MIVLQTINLGAAPNDNTGDPIRVGGQKINENFEALNNASNKITENNVFVFKYPGNVDLTAIEQKDVVKGIIDSAGTKYLIEAQYNTGSTSDFGTLSGFFNDGSYNTLNFTELQ